MERFELPGGFAERVRLFPLPNLVLFPCTAQPLHIFENRYCEMLEDALSGDQLITMATLRPDHDPLGSSGPPALAAPVCVGRIVSCDRRRNGTYDVLLVGLKRAIIHRELPVEREFRQAQVRVIESTGGGLSPADRTLGRTLVERIQRLAPLAKPMLSSLLSRDFGLSELTDILAFHTNLSTEMKLSLLTEGCPVRRAEMILDALPTTEAFDGGDLPAFSLN